METKHTPGPWRIEGQEIVGARYVAKVHDWSRDNVAEQYADIEAAHKAEHRANAQLIAAAPDGLQAAIDALQAADEMGIECPGAEGLRAFIAKATGNPA